MGFVTVQTALAVGSVLWGVIASWQGTRVTLLVAAATFLVLLALHRRVRVRLVGDKDIMLSDQLPALGISDEPEPEDGPVLIQIEYRIDEIDARHNPSRVRLFVEYKPMPDWTIRVFGEELAQIPFTRDRLIYTGLRDSAPLNYRELRHLNNGALFGVNLQYNFGL